MKNYCHLSGHVTGRRKPCEKGALCRKGILPAAALSIIHGVRIALRARDVSLQSNVHAHTHTSTQRLLLTTSCLLFIQKGPMQQKNLDSRVQSELLAVVSSHNSCMECPALPFASLHFSSLSALGPTKKLNISSENSIFSTIFDMLGKGTKSKKGCS